MNVLTHSRVIIIHTVDRMEHAALLTNLRKCPFFLHHWGGPNYVELVVKYLFGDLDLSSLNEL